MQVQETQRVSITLPVETMQHLDFIAERLGCTRSAVCCHLLGSGASELLPVVLSVSGLPSADGVSRRARGRTVEELSAVFDHLEELLRERDIKNMLAADYRLTREQDGAL